jgi:hypothetical protein
VTDTASPITEPHLTPMFATGGQPALAPNTEPHHAPIFDTGPHPDPLPSAATTTAEPADEGESAEWASAEWDSDEWRSAEWRNPDPEENASDAVAEPVEQAELVEQAESAESESAESESAEPDSAGVADLNLALGAIDGEPQAPVHQAFSQLDNGDTDAFLRSVTGHMQPVAVPAHPVVVPGNYQFLKRWKFALIVAGVWVLAAAAGLGFYYWWYTALVKTLPVFGILLFLVVCMVASLLVSMVTNRPQITALAIALMAAPLAATAAAAVLHGAYYFEWIARPIIG